MDDLLARLGGEGEHETYPRAREEDDRAGARPSPPALVARVPDDFSNGAYLFMLQEVSAAGAGNPQIGAIQDALSIVNGRPRSSRSRSITTGTVGAIRTLYDDGTLYDELGLG